METRFKKCTASDASRCKSSQWRPARKTNQLSLFISCFLLPILCLLLLPSSNQHPKVSINVKHQEDRTSLDLNSFDPTQQSGFIFLSQLLSNLISSPLVHLRHQLDQFERLKLSAGHISLAQAARSDLSSPTSRQDLQEEEAHLLASSSAQDASLASHLLAQQASYQHPVRAPMRLAGGPPVLEATQLAPDHPGLDQATGDYGAPAGEPGEAGELAGPTIAGGELASNSAGQQLQARSDLPAVKALNVKCEKNHMMVNIVFDRPFYGTVFSKGHYNDQKCVHVPANSGQTSVNFDVHLGKCGMSSSDTSPTSGLINQQGSHEGQPQPHGLYIENTIIIQYDPQVQEIYDQARKLRCTWYDYYEKSVTFRPYNVDMLDAVTANFLGDNIQCWMQIQVGKGPWSSEVAGIVKIGQTMTMVLAIKDDENRFDMLVRNCVAHDGKHQPIQLVDEYGCVARPKIMAKFQKVRNFGPAATVVSYAHFQAFKFPDSMSVHFQCVIQVCRFECPEPKCPGGTGNGPEMVSGAAGVSGTDYAASGTELVAAKEHPSSYLSANATIGQVAQPRVRLGSGESDPTSRLQVHLDTTSLMRPFSKASQQQQQALNGGPLPPHLLHASSSESGGSRSGHAYLASSSNPGPSVFRPTSSQQATGGASVRGQPAGALKPPAPPAGHPAIHYSSPYQQRMAYVAASQRLGDLAPPEPTHQAATDEHQGSARGLRNAPSSASTGHPNHRYRRHVPTGGESTAVKTHRTIQVVSPDDVAFNLLASGSGDEPLRPASQHNQQQQAVCFSAWKLMLALSAFLAVLSSSILIVIYLLVLRHRAERLDEKLAAGSSIYSTVSSDDSQLDEEQARLRAAHQERRRLAQQRQQAELDQRNNYLARLYSQFVPTNYWQGRPS